MNEICKDLGKTVANAKGQRQMENKKNFENKHYHHQGQPKQRCNGSADGMERGPGERERTKLINYVD